MVGLISRILLVVAGFFASFFVAEDALIFPVVQMVISVVLFTSFVAFIAFLPEISRWWQGRKQK